MDKLISIVMPTRNRRVMLKQALESCLQQTYRNIEVLVVDDASDDDTFDYVRSCQDPRVVYIRRPVRGGSVACLNAGFARSRGDYLTWSSDDDYYAPEAVGRLVAELDASADVDFVYSHYWMVDESGHVLNAARVEDPQGLDRDNYVGHCFLYRRKVYETVGDYRAEPFLAEEYEYWLRVRARFRMKRIAEPLYFHRLHPGSLTLEHGSEKIQDAIARARRSFIPAWKHFFLTGERYYFSGNRWRAFWRAVISLMLWPWHWPIWRLLALSLVPKPLLAWVRSFRRDSEPE
ncbi:MAG: glycosyltransferase [Candidatus Omnitrophica bacterium]|nr:glycosyltransferase [Candidatus Omnitrophota bacterium]